MPGGLFLALSAAFVKRSMKRRVFVPSYHPLTRFRPGLPFGRARSGCGLWICLLAPAYAPSCTEATAPSDLWQKSY